MMENISRLNGLSQWKGDKTYTLDSIIKIMSSLGNPQDKIRTVHVTGTNGKGSVCASTAAIFAAAGLKTGLFISPHLSKVNERITINGDPISDELLDTYLAAVFKAADQLREELSYFEAITATAFLCFYKEGIDIAVIEVGLGGTKDATNILSSPSATAIVSIALDHQRVLGDTVEEIALDKAGIIKKGVPLVLGEVGENIYTLIHRETKIKEASLRAYGKDFIIENSDKDGKFSYIHYNEGQAKEIHQIETSLVGEHQRRNISISLEIAQIAGIDEGACREGLKKVFWPARLEWINVPEGEVLLDCAHNPAGISTLVDYLVSHNVKLGAIAFGALEGKEWRDIVKQLIPFSSKWFILRPNSNRAVPMEDLKECLSGFGVKPVVYGDNLDQFYRDQLLSLEQEERILVSGSIYLVGKIREYLKPEAIRYWK